MKVMLVWPENQGWPEVTGGVEPVQWLKQVQVLVGGYAERVHLTGHTRFIISEGEPMLRVLEAWVNEDGVPTNLPLNRSATQFLGHPVWGYAAIIAEVVE